VPLIAPEITIDEPLRSELIAIRLVIFTGGLPGATATRLELSR
jgi:hypothetical protein